MWGVVELISKQVVLELDNEKKDKYAILTVQPRIAAASLAFTEIPAGMMDTSDKFSGNAARELKEECGLVIEANDLMNMTEEALKPSTTKASESNQGPPKSAQEAMEQLKEAMYPSPGACDEAIGLMLYQKKMTEEQMKKLQGAKTGLTAEGEVIVLKLVELKNLWKEAVRDSKALAALLLYEKLHGEGKIQEPTEYVQLVEKESEPAS